VFTFVRSVRSNGGGRLQSANAWTAATGWAEWHQKNEIDTFLDAYSAFILLTAVPIEKPVLAAVMPSPEEHLMAKILRLQADRENLVYILANTELSEEHRAQLQTQLLSVQEQLVMLTGGISVN
jgi:hypothetical protein